MKSYKLLIAFIMLPLVILAAPDDKFKKSKSISKKYEVNADAQVDIENSFGDVTVEIWDQNVVTLEIYVEVSGNDEETVDNQLREVTVDFNASASRVSAETEIPSVSSGIFSWLKGKGNTNTRVNYRIKMPKGSPLDLSNDYGAIIIDKFEAPLKISCDFGRLDLGQLLHTDNYLSFDYTKNSHVDYAKEIWIKADFSEFQVYGSDKIDFSGDYTTARLPKVPSLKYNSDFSTVIIEGADQLDGRGDYSTVKIEDLSGPTVINADFGTLTIANLMSSFKSLEIKCDYTTVKINYSSDNSFQYEMDSDFGSQKLDNNLQYIESRNDNGDRYNKGYFKDNNSSNRIEVNSSFGSVSLKSN